MDCVKTKWECEVSSIALDKVIGQQILIVLMMLVTNEDNEGIYLVCLFSSRDLNNVICELPTSSKILFL